MGPRNIPCLCYLSHSRPVTFLLLCVLHGKGISFLFLPFEKKKTKKEEESAKKDKNRKVVTSQAEKSVPRTTEECVIYFYCCVLMRLYGSVEQRSDGENDAFYKQDMGCGQNGISQNFILLQFLVSEDLEVNKRVQNI